jgi:hypothetical protein
VQFSASRRKHRTHHPDDRFGSTKGEAKFAARCRNHTPEARLYPVLCSACFLEQSSPKPSNFPKGEKDEGKAEGGNRKT